ncbi:hypothetical protein O181_037834 [Austropuccinia psidii MF-1]|uniref:Uncharacterized protein n=1 Tax=Austropuccinia psidii MF-1 TaxID=1389203 RepID=A0A9Q3D7B6_9BASI|nr:hypothetical protein [Austropuccinia psidii MF-1]
MSSSNNQLHKSQSNLNANSLNRRNRPSLPHHFIESNYTKIKSNQINNQSNSSSFTNSKPQTNRFNRFSDNHSHTIDRFNGIQSALSHHDEKFNSIKRRPLNLTSRSKHSSWTAIDQSNIELIRSQSVISGAFQSRQFGQLRKLKSNSCISESQSTIRSISHHDIDDEDDGQTSMTTYNNSFPIPHKSHSNGSRGQGSDELRSKIGTGTASLFANGLISTPSRHRILTETDRTVRGSNGTDIAPNKLTSLFKTSREPSRSFKHPPSNLSSSSGTSSRRNPLSHPSDFQRTSVMTRRPIVDLTFFSQSVNGPHQKTTPTRPGSSAAIQLAGLLSPTPSTHHHNLLITAYEALDRSQIDSSHQSRVIHATLIGLLSSVVKNSCKIDATLAQLTETHLKTQVEVELVDDEDGEIFDDNNPQSNYNLSPQKLNAFKQKYNLIKNDWALMKKIHNQLTRTSSDQIRDLTQVLISLNKLNRSHERELIQSNQTTNSLSRMRDSLGSIDTREYSERTDAQAKSSSPSTGRLNPSRSPSKLGRTFELNPFSPIDSLDDSPSSKIKPKFREPLQKFTPQNHPNKNTNPHFHSDPLHHRASTISFPHDRKILLDQTHQQPITKNRMPDSTFSTRPNRKSLQNFNDLGISRTFLHQSRTGLVKDNKAQLVDELGMYRRSIDRMPISYQNSDGRAFQRERRILEPPPASNTIRGCRSSLAFPKAPERLATSISPATAQFNVSPTRPLRQPARGVSQCDSDLEQHIRPKSSIGQILRRANTVLSRVGNYPDSRPRRTLRDDNQRMVQNEDLSDTSFDDYQNIESNRKPDQRIVMSRSELNRLLEPQDARLESLHRSGRKSEGDDRTNRKVMQTADALGRMNQFGSWNARQQNDLTELRRSTDMYYSASEDDLEEIQDDREQHNGIRRRKESFKRLFRGSKKGLVLRR